MFANDLVPLIPRYILNEFLYEKQNKIISQLFPDTNKYTSSYGLYSIKTPNSSNLEKQGFAAEIQKLERARQNI